MKSIDINKTIEAFATLNPLSPDDLEQLEQSPDLVRTFAAIRARVTEAHDAPSRRFLGQRLSAVLDRRGFRLVVVGAAAVAAVVLGLTTPWQSSGPSIVERALSAIGTGPVLHAVVEQSSPNDAVVDIATGKERPRVHRIEYWYDSERQVLHTRLTTDGQQLSEIVERPNSADSDLGHFDGHFTGQLDPALAGFITHYRQELADGTATVVGHDRVDGRDVTLINIALPEHATEQVAVDRSTYEPLSFHFVRSDASGSDLITSGDVVWHVVEIGSIPRNARDFAPPKLVTRPSEGSSFGSDEVTETEAATALEQPAVWPGRSIAELPLASATVDRVRTRWTDGREEEAKSLTLNYGAVPAGRPGRGALAGGRNAAQSWLTIDEAASVSASYPLGFNNGGDPAASVGSIVLVNIHGRPGYAVWIGRLVTTDGLYVALTSPSRELVLQAARALKPISG